MPQLSMHAPIGDLPVSVENDTVVSLDWGWARDQEKIRLLQTAKSQLEEYFDGHRKIFELPLMPSGTEYQKRVWSIMNEIPYGKTIAYGKIAATLNTSPRAVGMACGSNPIPIIMPCHRVIAANGMGGYSGNGGVRTKATLLRLEGVLL